MKKIVFLLLLSIFLFSQSALAHHAWVEKEGDRYIIAWGHPPKISPYDPANVQDIKGFGINGGEVALKRMDEKEKVYLSSNSPVSMICLSLKGNFLVSTPEGKKRLTKKEAQQAGLQVIDSFYSSQSAKSVFAYSAAVTNPAGMKMEIIPLKNPLALKPNEALPVRVLFEGKPIEGAAIQVGDHKDVGKTDKNGEYSVQLTGKGMQAVLAQHKVSTKDSPDADYISYLTALTFEMK